MLEEKKLKVIIFEDDPVILNRFRSLFVFNGHSVLSYSDPATCPLFRGSECNCQKDSPCADVIVAEMDMRGLTGLEFFQRQRDRGCRALDRNKLLLGSDLTAEQQAAINKLGCRFIKKPFDAYEVAKWLEECAKVYYSGSPTIH